MASRYYNRILDCGCMLSSDGGGGLMPCNYWYGCGGENCDRENLCERCMEDQTTCGESWDKFRKSEDYKTYLKEIKERNS